VAARPYGGGTIPAMTCRGKQWNLGLGNLGSKSGPGGLAFGVKAIAQSKPHGRLLPPAQRWCQGRLAAAIGFRLDTPVLATARAG
jgi:hypothetical protein